MIPDKRNSPEPSRGNQPVTDLMKILVVDDDRLSAHNLGIQLKFVGENPVFATSEGWPAVVDVAGNQNGLLAVLIGNVSKVDLGLLLTELHRECPLLPLLLIRRHEGTLPVFSASLKERLELLSQAELSYEMLSAALQKARELRGLAPRNLQSRIITPAGSALFRSLTGHSKGICRIRELIDQVAALDVPVLIQGESGTGKEVVARNLHYHSGRGGKPFIAVNCAAIAADHYGVELFGQSKGPGVPETVPGLLDKAQGGTLYFDEVGELPMNIQTLLLRFIEDRSFQRTGSAETIHTDVHILAGSNRRLEQAIERGSFRPDLYYRLNLMPIELPPLRRRQEDIPDLVRELLRSLEGKGYRPVSLNAAAVESLQHHNWPGNVRELANLVERLCIMHDGGVIGINDLPMEYQQVAADTALLGEIEKRGTATEAGVAEPQKEPPKAESPVENGAEAIAMLGRRDAAFAMLPLNEKMLRHYLENFAKQMLQTAMEDSANIKVYAAERLGLDEAQLETQLQRLS